MISASIIDAVISATEAPPVVPIAHDYPAIAASERALRRVDPPARTVIACSRCVEGWVLDDPTYYEPLAVVPWVACGCNPDGRRVRR